MFKSYEYYIFVSGIELIQMFKQNKLSDKQKSGVIKYILNYKSYKIQMLDVLQIKVKRKRKIIITYYSRMLSMGVNVSTSLRFAKKRLSAL